MLDLPFNKSELETITKDGIIKAYLITKSQMDMLEDYLEDILDSLELEKAIEEEKEFIDFDVWENRLKSEGKIGER